MLLLYVSLWFVARPLGTPLLIFVVGACVLSVLFFRGGFSFQGRNYFFYFFFVWVFYLIGSYFRIFDASYTSFYDNSVAFQQSFLYAVFFVGFLFWYSVLNTIELNRSQLFRYLLLTWGLASLIQTVMWVDSKGVADSFMFGTLHNSEMLSVIFLVYLIYNALLNKKILMLAAFIVLMAFSVSSQSFIAFFLALAFSIIPKRMAPVFSLLFVFIFVLFTFVAMQVPELFYEYDPNTGVRAVFWNDVLESTFDTLGIGVGFGTEFLREVFYIGVHDVVILDVDDSLAAFMNTGTHNLFFDILFRLGVLGLGSFLFFFYSVSAYLWKEKADPYDYWIFCVLFLTLFVNVALSVAFVFGTSFLFAWLAFKGSKKGRFCENIICS